MTTQQTPEGRARRERVAALGRVHLLGIGGVGVSGVARILQDQGVAISGSDAKDLPVMHDLAAGGARITVGYDAAHVGDDVTTVIASSIAGPGNPEHDAAVARGLRVLHRSEGLALAMEGHRVLAVAGTHGKTTTSSMAAMAFTDAGWDPTFAVGAAVAGLGTNARAGAGEWFVAEADESDGTLVNYPTTIAVVTTVEADHLDHYGTEEAVHEVFRVFAGQLPAAEDGGALVACLDDEGAAGLAAWAHEHARAAVVTYGTGPRDGVEPDLLVDGVTVEPGESGVGQRARFTLADGTSAEVRLQVPGRHNALNAAAVALAAVRAGMSLREAVHGLEQFRGTARRFEFRGAERGVRVFDDYAHHPTEVVAAVSAARAVAGEGRVHVLFQPHLFSRTRDFAAEFAAALSGADRVRVLPVYAAREEPMEGVDATLITRALTTPDPADRTVAVDRAAAVRELAAGAREGDVILTMGAGDVTALGPDLVAALAADPSVDA
ncbi:UDP-N-acetylmuramate--L-alanine ligase [Micrococcus porci]|uniref:UDP-N-acetylmuramate--L-alanine ligase n=1 Tax=Micrococcus porci TaxID=2856555 RepID=UPI001CCC5105|nr:UDP-N-acetylmuramate--L-alanine ligase [Micrococcus porci]UBH23692.1 UDP-N-acetylmuramate--L-alanine ligase [Micrococcus porci]